MPLRRTLIVIAVLCLATPAAALESIAISIGEFAYQGWSASGVSLQLVDLEAEDPELVVRGQELRSPLLAQPMRDIELRCRVVRLARDVVECMQGSVGWTLGSETAGGSLERLRFALTGKMVEATLRDITWLSGQLQVAVGWRDGSWRLQATAERLELARLLASGLLPSPAGLSLRGRGGFDIVAAQGAAETQTLRVDMRVAGLGFEADGGRFLGEGINATLHADATGFAPEASWQFAMTDGAVLTPYLYLEPVAGPIRANGRFALSPSDGRISVGLQELDVPSVIQTAGELVFGGDGELRGLRVETERFDLGAVHRQALEPALTAPSLRNLSLQGSARLALRLGEDGLQRLSLDLEDAGLQRRGLDDGLLYSIEGIDAALRFDDAAGRPQSRLAWRRASLFDRVPVGAAELDLVWSRDGLQLAAPVDITVFDGALAVQRFGLVSEDGEPRLEFAGVITPISMQAITEALGWVPMTGSLSAVIPSVSLAERDLSIDGTLLVRAFDGRVRVNNLAVSEPFSVFPVLEADLSFHDLDLDALTRTFAFGKITGRLEGHMRGLRLENWQPVAFDARFATPLDDRSRHRISQRAVDNISNLGGVGAAGALSRGFLQIFEEFGYDRLGIACQLTRGVCVMDGVEPANGGYYLVKGSGLPRIDVLGFNRQTDWQTIVNRLVAIAQGERPTIQ